MPMTIVREGDDAATISARLGIPHGPIGIDAVVVDVYASMGVDAATLREAITRHDPAFRPAHKEPIDVPGGSGVELYGVLEAQDFRLDRIVVGDVTYFGADQEGISHVTDYGPMRGAAIAGKADDYVGRELSSVVRKRAFQSERSPVVRGAMTTTRGAVHLEVEGLVVPI